MTNLKMMPFFMILSVFALQEVHFIYAQTISVVTVHSLDEMQTIVRREVDMSKESWLGFWSKQKIFTRVASIHCIVVISLE
jgi:hypothetical protein